MTGRLAAERDRTGPLNPNWRGGKSGHPLYYIYHDMIGRCHRPTHPRYADYGGRGITVCERWRGDFWAFVSDMGERPEGRSLDRANNDKGYSPENCRWATAVEQRHNRRPQRLKPACKHNHRFTPENTGYTRSGKRRCLACDRENTRKHRQNPAHKQAKSAAKILREQERHAAVIAAAQALAADYLRLGGDYTALQELSARLGIGKQAVRVRLRKVGIVPPDGRPEVSRHSSVVKQSRYSPADRIAMRDLYEAGISQRAIALQFGTDQAHVSKMLRQMRERSERH